MLIGISAAATAPAVHADEVAVASGSVGTDIAELQAAGERFKAKTGHTLMVVTLPASTTDQFGQYRLWLAAGNADIDVYRTDVIWAPQLAEYFVDLKPLMGDLVSKHIPAVIESQTVDGKLVAMPTWADASALYYRKDLLDKYGKQPPKTWDELTSTAKEIQEKERAGGASDLWGFVFQGAPYEGLTCDALEWVASFGGGKIVEPDGTISINNPKTAAALEMAKGWIGTVSPPGSLSYKEEDARGVWQTGKAVFMRNWPYAYSLGNGGDSAIKGKFDVAPLPGAEGGASVSTLGGWNVALSKYSKHQDAAVEFIKFWTSDEEQKYRAIQNTRLPTIPALYDDAEIKEKQPLIARWKDVFAAAVPRPSAPTKAKYNEVSSEFWTAVNNTLAGNGTADSNLKRLEARLKRLKGRAW
ncbi:ABC transporter substrate-binding protein [Aureimonas leprariae]|uniref:ABC transporter substrate-binding protein n=1 Tax=Plantimonas leprariae TaxID=2615207 RepID=A0A7V7TXC3_9HYPH|nr:ABC transporter substrate-binding protein [Aureimonas leprariae]KAB0680943.1 ABC transporter substrate-binding protein [Aureimonas leprariae]